ncbi:hypothetical protein JCM30566_09450 [Marinitoga arctica]
MHKRFFKRLKNYKDVELYFKNEIKDDVVLETVKNVLYEEEDESYNLIEGKDKIRYIKFYRSGSCELCYEEYIDETKTKLNEWKINPPDFRDNSLKLEIIFEVREK